MSLPFEPYLYLLVAKENIQEVTAFLSKKYGQYILKITQVEIFFKNIVFNYFLSRFIKRTWTCIIIWLV